ncbi:MAG: dienelactone hydrolase family protein [Streptosporangiales bacterium]|nr:dienelactone hydrolase family protein [Streptosporangiales bacterium]MBO0889432.1 dienelactone hydrolase family protein [Acidothermales bacterium]
MIVSIPAAGGTVPGHLEVPSPELTTRPPWPGVVVVHDAVGMTDDTRALTARFATAGYLALAPDLFSRGNRMRCVRSAFAQLRRGTGQVGVAGFCMGGGFALLLAPDFDVAAPYYGEVPEPDRLDDACPIVASYGGRDRRLRGSAEPLDRLLTECRIPHDVEEYPDAGHRFANRLDLGPLTPLLRVTGIGYHHGRRRARGAACWCSSATTSPHRPTALHDHG